MQLIYSDSKNCPDVSHFWIMSAISQEQLNQKTCETPHLIALSLSYLSIFLTTICDQSKLRYLDFFVGVSSGQFFCRHQKVEEWHDFVNWTPKSTKLCYQTTF